MAVSFIIHGAAAAAIILYVVDSTHATGGWVAAQAMVVDLVARPVGTWMGPASTVRPVRPFREIVTQDAAAGAEDSPQTQSVVDPLVTGDPSQTGSSPETQRDTAVGVSTGVAEPHTLRPGGYPGELSRDERLFLEAVRHRLDAAKRYPSAARRLGQEGTARLQFTITRSGDPEKAHLIQSSGWAMIDREAMALVKRVGRFPRPPEMWKEDAAIQVPVVFHLGRP